jgi:pSer/pThr/pTyr-binding forkhead associated (FHA) protein
MKLSLARRGASSRQEVEPLVDPGATLGGVRAAASRWSNGPKLILVRGGPDGLVYPLEGPGTSWRIGRSPDCAVCLADPYASRQGAEVWRDGDVYHVEDLWGDRNGVDLNWRPLGRHETAVLEDGDILRVGASLLVFRSR